jgi:predicted RNase H-like HicB family nuclease
MGLEGTIMKYAIVYEQSGKGWGAHVPDLPICFAKGKTYDEVRQLIHEGIDLHIAALREEGFPVPEPKTIVEEYAVA